MEQLDSEFLYEIFNAALNRASILETLILHLKENYLPDDSWRKIFLEAKTQYEINKKVPTYGTLRLSFRKNENCLNLLNKIRKTDSTDKEELLLNNLETFLKRGLFLEIHHEIVENFNQDNTFKAYNKFLKGAEKFTNFSIREKEYEQIFKGFNKRNVQRLIDNVNTKRFEKLTYGIDELDYLTGRPETGEYILFLAPAKAGKSFCLSHVGMSIARMGHPVAHFQLEGTKQQCLNRYDAAFTGTLIKDIKRGEIDHKKFKKIKRIVSNLGKGEIFVFAPERFSSMNMLEIRKKVIELKKKFGLKAVVIDYLELSDPGIGYYKPSEEKRRQQKISQQMKDLAVEQDILVVSATQANNISFELLNDPEFVIRREHLSEDKAKVNPVDGLITINRTKEESKHHSARLFIDAYRESEADKVIQIATSINRGRFYNRKRTLNEFFIND